MFQRIIVGVDGSKGAEVALRKAAELAALCGAELHVATIYRHHSRLEASLALVRKDDRGDMDDIMREHATEVAEHAKSIAAAHGAPHVRAFVKAGQPARSLVAFAKEHGGDLIVVGSRGLGSAEGYLLGSVSHKITGLAECPVLVV